MVANSTNWLEQVGHGSQFNQLVRPRQWAILANWLVQVGHGSQLIRISEPW